MLCVVVVAAQALEVVPQQLHSTSDNSYINAGNGGVLGGGGGCGQYASVPGNAGCAGGGGASGYYSHNNRR